jgi:hypothetical protein
VDPYPDLDSESGSGPRGAKMTHKDEIGKLKFLIKKKIIKNFSYKFFQFLVMKTLDPDQYRYPA